MRATVPYLMLPGTCADAITFYCDVFGAAVTIRQTLGAAGVDVQPEAADLIFNAELRNEEFVLKASDDIQTDVSLRPNVAVFTECDSSAEHGRIFDSLAAGGEILFPLDGGFGMVVDRFGVAWMLAGPQAEG